MGTEHAGAASKQDVDDDRDDEAPPPTPAGPPWPANVVAALHAGCYDAEDCVDPDRDPVVTLWAAVRADPEATALLDRLDEVREVLRRLGRRVE